MILQRQDNPKDIRQRIKGKKQGKVKIAKITAGKGWSESKWLAAKSVTSSSLVRVVRALTCLSRSFFSIRFSDTREGSSKPEKVHNLERRCCSG
jgi:hypothetical protein